MKVDSGLMGVAELANVPARAKALEAQGYDGMVTAEIANDPFLPLALAAEHTERIELMTSIAVAFARNPMVLANIGNDLQALSKGRFVLGLGSQIKPHITKRFSQEWSRPAARMPQAARKPASSSTIDGNASGRLVICRFLPRPFLGL